MSDIDPFIPGERLSAAKLERLRAALDRKAHGRSYLSDSTGDYIIDRPPTATEDQYLRLTSNLAAHETSPAATATGNLGTWNGSGYDWDTEEVTVQDLSGGHWALKGERIRVRARTVSGNTIYEALSRGSDKHIVTLSGNLTNAATAAATCTINGVTATVYVVHGNFVADGDTIVGGTQIAVFYDLANGWVADNARCG